jgi:hypothetical protein
MIRRVLTVALIVIAAPFTTGCSSMSNTGKGALAGGGLGAGAGALIDRATGGKGGAGAVVGGITGAVLGGAIGNDMDQREKATLQARADEAEAHASASARQLGMADVMQMAKEGQSDDVIINQIRTTGSTYTLSAEDLRMLRANNVSDPVIICMQNQRPDRHPRGRLVAIPPHPPVIYAPPPPVYVVGPPPPPVFGVGVRIRH